jgi:outer membrane immunogenic protein
MKKLALHVTAISLLLAGSAAAADLRRPAPVKAPLAPAPVVYNWTGCYVGAGGGYGMWNQDSTLLDAGVPDFPEQTFGGRGWFGTVQVGCDYQIGSNIVIGAFADYDFASIKGDISIAGELFGEEKLKSSWAAGGRIGWLPFPQLLTFVSGGYTQARFGEVHFASSDFTLARHTYSGWFIGTGYEYGIGWLPGLFWKTEYRFADYGKENVALLDGGAPSGFTVDSHKYTHMVRSELVWRFNWSSPVVARY